MVDLSNYHEVKPNRFRRILWMLLNRSLFRICPSMIRIALLRTFGAKIGNSLVYRSVDIYDPANLSIGDYSCIGPYVDLYCKDRIDIGNNVVVSQWAYVCTASHDISSPVMALKTSPVKISDGVWIAAHAKVIPGVTIGPNAVVGMAAVVVKSVGENDVVGGNPATVIKKRSVQRA